MMERTITKIKIVWSWDSNIDAIMQSQSMLAVFLHHQHNQNVIEAACILLFKEECAAL